MFIDVYSLKNKLSYSIVSNICSTVVSVFMVLILPKYLSVYDYSVWQLYLFYIVFLGILHFGWIDGIYLRYAGYYFEELDKTKFTAQFLAFISVELIISLVGYILLKIYVYDDIYITVLSNYCIIFTFRMASYFCSFILQTTSKVKEFAMLTIFERILFFITVIILIITKECNIKNLLKTDIVCNVFMFIYSFYLTRQLFSIKKIEHFNAVLTEIFSNISVGVKLLFANVAGMMVLGIFRFGIASEWDIETFGKISLSITISNFLMIFINALSTVFFPLLSRLDFSEQKGVYLKVRKKLTNILLVLLIVFYPLYIILEWWLPQYKESLEYLAILFPICFYECKTVLLANTYLKSLRFEGYLLFINVISVLFGASLTFLSAVIIHDLTLVIFSILLLFIIKNIMAEFYVCKILKIKFYKYAVYELLLIIMFVFCNYTITAKYIAAIIYLIGLTIYLRMN